MPRTTLVDTDLHDGMRSSLERAVEQAIALRRTIVELQDPALREIVDVVLIELGRRVAERTRRRPKLS